MWKRVLLFLWFFLQGFSYSTRINLEARTHFWNYSSCLLKGIFVPILSFSLPGSKKLKDRKGKDVSKAEVMQLLLSQDLSLQEGRESWRPSKGNVYIWCSVFWVFYYKRMNWDSFLHLKEVWFDSSFVTLYHASLDPPAGFCQGSSKKLSDASSEGSYKPCWFPGSQFHHCTYIWGAQILYCKILCSIMLSHMDTFLRVWLKSLIWLSWIDFCREALMLQWHMWVQQALGSGAGWSWNVCCAICQLPSAAAPCFLLCLVWSVWS